MLKKLYIYTGLGLVLALALAGCQNKEDTSSMSTNPGVSDTLKTEDLIPSTAPLPEESEEEKTATGSSYTYEELWERIEEKFGTKKRYLDRAWYKVSRLEIYCDNEVHTINYVADMNFETQTVYSLKLTDDGYDSKGNKYREEIYYKDKCLYYIVDRYQYFTAKKQKLTEDWDEEDGGYFMQHQREIDLVTYIDPNLELIVRDKNAVLQKVENIEELEKTYVNQLAIEYDGDEEIYRHAIYSELESGYVRKSSIERIEPQNIEIPSYDYEESTGLVLGFRGMAYL